MMQIQLEFLKKTKKPFVLNHIKGEPKICKKIPNIKMLFWIYMIFLKNKLKIIKTKVLNIIILFWIQELDLVKT